MKWPRWFKKKKLTEAGSLNPTRLENVAPLSAKREAQLRGVYFDCPNVHDLLDELDRRDDVIKKQDHNLWLLVNKKKRLL